MYLLLGAFLISNGFLVFYLFLNPQFGGKVEEKDLLKYQLSPNWKKGKFTNLEKTSINITAKTLPGLLREQVRKAPERQPEKALKVLPFDAIKFAKNDKPKFIWYGHSVLLLQIGKKNLLIDPMFGADASPIGPVRTKRFSENTLEIIDKLPKIDAVLITHDHYDHLDLASIDKLKTKVDTFLVSLGLGRHLERWGIAADNIKSFDWWDHLFFEGIEITFTPTRHFTGRGVTDRAKSLWGGWVFKTENHSVYWSGDGGYGKHFQTIGEKLGPFDIAFMECGQYNKNWHQIHLYPEESVQAALDANAQIVVPVHWAGFKLALHSWKQPVERFVAAAQSKKQTVFTPKIGEIVSFTENYENELWYKNIN